MTLHGFNSSDSFTAEHRAAFEKAVADGTGQSVAIKDVAVMGSDASVRYKVEVASLEEAVLIEEAINKIAVNETRFVIIVVQRRCDGASCFWRKCCSCCCGNQTNPTGSVLVQRRVDTV
jgi:hypothetical protein